MKKNWLGKDKYTDWPDFLSWKFRSALCAVFGHAKPEQRFKCQTCSRCHVVLPRK